MGPSVLSENVVGDHGSEVDEALALVEAVDLPHVLLGQGKVPDLEVGLDALL